MTSVFERDVETIVRSKENEYVYQGNFIMGPVGKKEPLTSLVRVEVKEDKLEYNYGINRAFDGPYTIEGETSDVGTWMSFFNAYDDREEVMYKYCEEATAFRIPDVRIVENDMLIKYLKCLTWSFLENQVRGDHIVLINPDIMTVHIAVRSKPLYNFYVYYTSKSKLDVYSANKEDTWFEAILIPDEDVAMLDNAHPGAIFYFGFSLLLHDYIKFSFNYYGYVLNPDHPCVALHGIDDYFMGRYYDSRLRSEVILPRYLVTEPVEEVSVKSKFIRYEEFKGMYGVLRKCVKKSFAYERPGSKVIVDPLYLKGSLMTRDEKYDHPVLGELVVRFNDSGAYDFNRLIYMGQKINILKDMGIGVAWVSQDCPTFSMNTYSVAMSEYDYHMYVYEGLKLSKEPDIHSYYTFKNISLNFAMEDFGPLHDVSSDKLESLRIAYALPPNYGYYKEYYDVNKVVLIDVRLYAPDSLGSCKFKYTSLRSATDPVGQYGTSWYLTYSIPYDFPFGYVISWRDTTVSSIELSHWSRAVFESYADTEIMALDS